MRRDLVSAFQGNEVIIGDASAVAIESHILQAFHRLSFRALGSFTIHVNGLPYGVDEPDATLMAVSAEEVERRIRDRGTHVTPFTNGEATAIADAYRCALYGKQYGRSYPGMTVESFASVIQSAKIQWAPDGDEAFDDSSYILQFDAGDQVRLIAFKLGKDGRYDPSTLNDIWVASDRFYEVLHRWRDNFLAEWASLPKFDD